MKRFSLWFDRKNGTFSWRGSRFRWNDPKMEKAATHACIRNRGKNEFKRKRIRLDFFPLAKTDKKKMQRKKWKQKQQTAVGKKRAEQRKLKFMPPHKPTKLLKSNRVMWRQFVKAFTKHLKMAQVYFNRFSVL